MGNFRPLTSADVPAFVDCLRKYPLSMADEIAEYPLQHYTLRVNSPDTFYVQVPGICYMALDPITKNDAVIHFIRDPLYRYYKKKYLDTGKAFMLQAFKDYDINRLTLTVNEGSDQAFIIAKLLGFHHEGTMRKCRIINGKFIDVHLFGVLRCQMHWIY